MCREEVEKRGGKLDDKRQHLSPRLSWCERRTSSEEGRQRQEEKTEKVVYERIEGVGLVIQRESSGKKTNERKRKDRKEEKGREENKGLHIKAFPKEYSNRR